MPRVVLTRMSPEGVSTRPVAPPPVAPPLGLLYIASALRRWCKSDVDVQVYSLATDVTRLDRVTEKLSVLSPDILGLGALTIDESRLFACARAAKAASPEMVVVAGGPHPTLNPERCLSERSIDYVVIGEGERTMTELVDAISAGDDPRDVSGLAWLDASGAMRRSAPRAPVENLDDLPPPAWDLARFEVYSKLFNFHDLPPLTPPYAPITTMRGCPYRCVYCHNMFGRKARTHSAARVLSDLRTLYSEYGVREIHVVDDIFNVDAERLREIAKGITSSHMKISLAFPNGLRGDILTREQIELLREAGCYSVTFALETASKRLQKLIRKNLKIDRVLENAAIASSMGMITHCYAMLGFPTETREEMLKTVETVLASDFDLPRIFTVCPFPGTELFDIAVKNGFVPPRSDMGSYDYDRAAVNASTLPDSELADVVKDAHHRIYTHPPRVARLGRILEMYGATDDPHFKHGAWNIVRPLLGEQPRTQRGPRVVLAMFHTLAREGRFSGNIQLSLLSGDLERLGIEHEMVALIMRPSDHEQNDQTVNEFLRLMKEWRPAQIVFYAMWLPWIADTLRSETGARVMSLDPAQPGDVPRELMGGLDLQSAVTGALAGAGSVDEAVALMQGRDEVTRFRPGFRYRFVGVDEPVQQKMAFVSLLSCPYAASILHNPVYADLPMDESVSLRGCAYCNGARNYSPMDEDEKRVALTHQIRHLQESIPTLEEIAVPFPEDYLSTLAHVFRMASSTGIRPIVISGQFRSESIVEKREQLEDMLEAARDNGFEFHMNVVGLESFRDEDLSMYNRGTVEGVRAALAVLRELRSRFDPATFMPTTVGSFILFHPWQTIEGLRTNVEQMRREGVRSLFHTININDMRFHTGVPMYHLARRDDLLAPVTDGDVQDVPLGGYFSESPWRFAHADTAGVHGLFTHLHNRTDDRPGLLEACLRLVERSPGSLPDASTVEHGLAELSRLISTTPLPRSGRRAVVHVGSRANTGYRRDLFGGRRYSDEIGAAREQLDALDDLSSTRVSVTGPEPTLLKWLPAFMDEMSKLGVGLTEVLTYGRMLAYDSYCAALAASGTGLVTVLLHSASSAVHDEAVRVPGCFDQATRGLANMKRVSGGRVRTAIAAVVGPENGGELTAMVGLATSLGCSELRIVVPLANLDLDDLEGIRQRIRATVDAAHASRLATGFDAELSMAFSV